MQACSAGHNGSTRSTALTWLRAAAEAPPASDVPAARRDLRLVSTAGSCLLQARKAFRVRPDSALPSNAPAGKLLLLVSKSDKRTNVHCASEVVTAGSCLLHARKAFSVRPDSALPSSAPAGRLLLLSASERSMP